MASSVDGFAGAAAIGISPKWLDTLGDRVGNMLLGNDADDFFRAPAAAGRRHHRHGRVAPCHPLHHVEHDVVLASECEIALNNVAEMHAGIGGLNATP